MNSLYTGGYIRDDEPATVEEVERSIEGEGHRQDDEEVQQTPDVRFEAYVMQDQRTLDTDDDIIRFHDRPPDRNTDSLHTTRTSKGAEGGIQGGGWQFQNPNRIKKKIKQIIRRELDRQDVMSEEEAAKV